MRIKFISLMILISLLFCVDHSMAQDDQKKIWLNPERYQIVLLKPGGGKWASGFNEVILLDTETGRTWTLKTKTLHDGWVLMPRNDDGNEKP